MTETHLRLPVLSSVVRAILGLLLHVDAGQEHVLLLLVVHHRVAVLAIGDRPSPLSLMAGWLPRVYLLGGGRASACIRRGHGGITT